MDFIRLTIMSRLFSAGGASHSREVSVLPNLIVQDLIDNIAAKFEINDPNLALYRRSQQQLTMLYPHDTLYSQQVGTGVTLVFQPRLWALPQGIDELTTTQKACLVEVESGAQFALEWQPAYIGRSEPGLAATWEYLAVDLRHISKNDRHISRRHALITTVGEEYQLASVRAHNLAEVNGKPVAADAPVVLRPEDRLSIGTVNLRFMER